MFSMLLVALEKQSSLECLFNGDANDNKCSPNSPVAFETHAQTHKQQ